MAERIARHAARANKTQWRIRAMYIEPRGSITSIPRIGQSADEALGPEDEDELSGCRCNRLQAFPTCHNGEVVPMSFSRRQWIQAASVALMAPGKQRADESVLRVAGQEVEIRIVLVSAATLRITVLPIRAGQLVAVPLDGSLVTNSWERPLATLRGELRAQVVKSGDLRIKIAPGPLAFTVETAKGEPIQQLKIDQEAGAVSFATSNAPLLGLGEGGPQFDRRGSPDRMRSGQGGYHLRTHGGRVPIPWLIGMEVWQMFITRPFGTFDFTGTECKFQPTGPAAALPLDIFFVGSREPATIMAEYARLTGHAELPPLWSFGYQQSHRTLASREEILEEARTFREKKLPCDA